MAARLKLTRPELKRYRDALGRLEHYLPMLKLKQQQLQMKLREVVREREETELQALAAGEKLRSYEAVLAERATVPVRQLAAPQEVRTSPMNIAGLEVPVFESVVFPERRYSLFSTAPWVDQALADMREVSTWQARLEVVRAQERGLSRELTRITQRVNLFEKIKIPQIKEAIRLIQIKLGDEMTAAVGRAKLAKAKLEDASSGDYESGFSSEEGRRS